MANGSNGDSKPKLQLGHVGTAGSVVSLVAVMGIAGWMIRPMEERIERLERSLEKNVRIERFDELEREVLDHHNLEGHPGVLTKVAAIDKEMLSMAREADETKRRVQIIEERDEWFMRTRIQLQAQIARLQEHNASCTCGDGKGKK